MMTIEYVRSQLFIMIPSITVHVYALVSLWQNELKLMPFFEIVLQEKE